MMSHAFVFARGGSKGVPGKNIKFLGNKPLLAYSIEMARNLDHIERTFVSTDDAEIAKIAREWGAEVIDRPPELAQDNSPEWLAWQHAVTHVEQKYGKFDVFVSLPTTSPLRSKDDVQACLLALSSEVDVVITVTEASNNPFFNMVSIDDKGRACLFNDGQEIYIRRQDVPMAYNMTTVAYVIRAEFVMKAQGVFDGVVKAVEVPQERAIDIDTPVDFEIARCLINNRDV